MRILNLTLKNIGTFLDANLNFITENDNLDTPHVTIITGENGTGKTIILDAIRGLFLGSSSDLERNIIRNENYLCTMVIKDSQSKKTMSWNTKLEHFMEILCRFSGIAEKPNSTWNWVIDYWTSKLSSDSFNAQSLVAPKFENLYRDSLSGIHKNIELTQLICYFDYLKSSENPKEKLAGEKLFDIIKKIVKLSLTDGEFKYVSRAKLEPIVTQAGQDVSLDKLSSGNLYMIQRMVALLGKMYSVYEINNLPLEELCQTAGVLLIDEAENHLHPKWQKTFINSILEIFPKLQIIVTTHSPFIVSSVENAKVYVCESQGTHATITDQTAMYSNKPIEEILLSPLFGSTYPFNQEISDLMQKRKNAIAQNDTKTKTAIEKQLQAINPQYFAFFDIDNLLGELTAN